MHQRLSSHKINQPSKLWLSMALALSIGLQGCALLPDTGPLKSTKPIEAYETKTSLEAANSHDQWPNSQWWLAYGDQQLNELISEALVNSPDMAAAIARFARANANSGMTGSKLYPSLSANASATEEKMSYNYLYPKSMLPNGWTDYGRATLDITWELDFWGKNRAALAAATSEQDASLADLSLARLSLASAIASSYGELARLFSARDTAKMALEVRTKTVTLFNQRYVNGLETKGSLKEAEARKSAAEGELLQLDELITLQRYQLAALMGKGPDRGLTIARPTVDLAKETTLPTHLSADLLGHRPDIVAARLRVQSQLKTIDSKKAEFYPNVNLTGFFGMQSLGVEALTKSGSSTGSIGPAVSLPIFAGGRLRAQLRASVASYDEAVANYDKTITQALQEVANAGASKKSLIARLNKADEAVQAAREAYEVAQNRYKGGLSSYLEVLSAEDGLLTSLRALTDLQARAFTLDVALQRALGGGYAESSAKTAHAQQD